MFRLLAPCYKLLYNLIPLPPTSEQLSQDHLRCCLLDSQLLGGGCMVAHLCLTLCNPMDYSTPGFPVLHYLPEFAQIHVHWISVIFCSHLLLLPSIFPSIRVFSNELALCIRWPEYWSFSFSISPSSKYSEVISFRLDWFHLLAVQGTLKSSPAPQFESIHSSMFSLLYGPILFYFL